VSAVRVKICGITSPEDALLAVSAGAFALGFNFHVASPRYVEVDRARAISAALPPGVWRVGVFVNRPRREVDEIAASAGLTALQFHGDEPPEYCRGWRLTVVKAARVRTRADVERLAAYPVELMLVDAYVEGVHGGTGERFDWSLLRGIDRTRLVLAGGLTPENVAAAVRTVRPFAVDVASGVEARPGIKDPEKVKQFVRHAETA
jgi:phosphoribosylanthranilate isomerase